MGVSKNSGTPRSSILIGFSIINHPFWGIPIFGNTHMSLTGIGWNYMELVYGTRILLSQTMQKKSNNDA